LVVIAFVKQVVPKDENMASRFVQRILPNWNWKLSKVPLSPFGEQGYNNNLQNITHKTKDRVRRTPLKTGGEFMYFWHD
jgi:hypothetical protein